MAIPVAHFLHGLCPQNPLQIPRRHDVLPFSPGANQPPRPLHRANPPLSPTIHPTILTHIPLILNLSVMFDLLHPQMYPTHPSHRLRQGLVVQASIRIPRNASPSLLFVKLKPDAAQLVRLYPTFVLQVPIHLCLAQSPLNMLVHVPLVQLLKLPSKDDAQASPSPQIQSRMIHLPLQKTIQRTTPFRSANVQCTPNR